MYTGNRRRHPRIYRPIEVDYYYGDEFYRESTISLSMGGLYVKTNQPLEVGSLFHVDFTLPDFNHLFKVRGKVIWKKLIEDTHGPPGMGIKFYDVAENDKRALLQYLAGSQKTLRTY
jgi:type IV pilus assembly protein PilZ